MDVAGARRGIERLRRAEERHERPAGLGPVEISVTPDPSMIMDDATVAAFAELGVTRLIPLPPQDAWRDPDRIVHFVQTVGERYCRA